ncbi:FAD-dependent monooxygenase, partial [Acinetobacter baumannii]
GRVVLIGDAAHATTPHAGQGASIALEDALRLSRLLRRGEEFGVTFAKFEAERRPRAERIVAAARRNGGSKGDMSRAGALIRDIAIKLLLP